MHKIRKFCIKLVYLILKKTFKFVATRRQILRLKCTKFNFGWRSAPDPAGALTTLPDLIAEFNRPTFGWQIGNLEGKGGMGANERRGKRPGPKRVGSHPVYENLENTLITELTSLVLAATRTFAPRGKHRLAATELNTVHIV